MFLQKADSYRELHLITSGACVLTRRLECDHFDLDFNTEDLKLSPSITLIASFDFVFGSDDD